jgi:hypothetical protein
LENRRKKKEEGELGRYTEKLAPRCANFYIAKWGYLPASISLLGRDIGEHCGRSGAFSELRLRNYELSAYKRNTCYYIKKDRINVL